MPYASSPPRLLPLVFRLSYASAENADGSSRIQLSHFPRMPWIFIVAHLISSPPLLSQPFFTNRPSRQSSWVLVGSQCFQRIRAESHARCLHLRRSFPISCAEYMGPKSTTSVLPPPSSSTHPLNLPPSLRRLYSILRVHPSSASRLVSSTQPLAIHPPTRHPISHHLLHLRYHRQQRKDYRPQREAPQFDLRPLSQPQCQRFVGAPILRLQMEG